ncbi:MAG: hypothetical protein IKS51_08435 [Erysipelotrichaceae bacterium]|nr:hypothetical protein [Erysipelotrichaceae bacterium]
MADLSNSKYVGTWKCVSVTVFGKTEELTVESRIHINADGTATQTSPEEKRTYTWKETGYGVFLDGKGDLKLKAEGDKLTTRIMGFVTLTYEKES